MYVCMYFLACSSTCMYRARRSLFINCPDLGPISTGESGLRVAGNVSMRCSTATYQPGCFRDIKLHHGGSFTIRVACYEDRRCLHYCLFYCKNYKFPQPYKMKYIILCCTILAATFAQPPVQGVTPTNVLSSSDQHASFSFVRPGLTQTAFAFSGPSSRQSFISSIGDAHLAQKVLPNVANALAYRNPGLGVFPGGPSAAHSYAAAPLVPPTFPSSFTFVPAPSTTRNVLNPALAYYQQLQQIQQPQPFDHHPAAAIYQPQLAQLVALMQAQAQSQANPHSTQTQQVLEQVESQQDEQLRTQSLLGISYSPAPSVARVNVSGNGYKFGF